MKLTRRAALAGPASACAILNANAEQISLAYQIPSSAVIPLQSAVNGVRYLLYVKTPRDPDSDQRSWPLIITLDADYSFSIAANHIEHLAERQGQGPKAVIVSIAYEGAYLDGSIYRRERTRDYTPFFSAHGGYGPEFQAQSGGGPAFLRVIAEEIAPLVCTRFNADAEDMTIVGHSFGGLFAAWALQTDPGVFRRYLIVSPSLWYGGQALINAERNPDRARLTRPAHVFLGVGGLEQPPHNANDMVGQVRLFNNLLAARGDPNLQLSSRVFEDETHASIFPAALSTGIRRLFGAS